MSYKLTWANDPTSEASLIYRSTAPLDAANLPAPLAVVDAGVSEYVDSAVADWTRYFYRVGAYREALGPESALSGEVAFGYDGGSTLDLQFAANDYQVIPAPGAGKVSRAFADIITFTRSTPAWEFDWQGNYSEVAAGVMRIAHDPLTKSTSTTPQTLGTGSYTFAVTYQYPIGKAVRVSADAANWMVGRVTASSPDSVTIWVAAAPVGAGTYSAWTLIVRRGIRVEEQRTNLLSWSSNFSNVAWAKSAIIVSPGSGVSPDGTAGASKLSEDSTSSLHSLGVAFTAVDNTSYTTSVYAKAGERNLLRIHTKKRDGVEVGTWFNLTTGAIGVRGHSSATIEPVGDGWYRLSATVDVLSGGVTAQTSLRMALVDGGGAYQGDGVSGVLIWRAQLEAGATPSSHIPTEGSQVIRAADVPVVNTVAPWFNAAEGTLVVVASRSSTASWSAAASLAVGETTASELYIVPGNPGSGTAHGELSISGVTNGANAGPVLNGAPARMALSYRAGAASFSAGGLPPVGIPAPSIPAFTRLRIGTRAGGNFPLNGIIESITYHPRVIDVQQASA